MYEVVCFFSDVAQLELAKQKLSEEVASIRKDKVVIILLWALLSQCALNTFPFTKAPEKKQDGQVFSSQGQNRIPVFTVGKRISVCPWRNKDFDLH